MQTIDDVQSDRSAYFKTQTLSYTFRLKLCSICILYIFCCILINISQLCVLLLSMDQLTNFYFFHILTFAAYLLFDLPHLQWTTYKKVVMSDDIETSPGPNFSTFNFFSWNLDSIYAQDLLLVLLLLKRIIHFISTIGLVLLRPTSTTL